MEGYWKPQPDSSWRCTTIGQKTVDTSRRVRNSPAKEKKKNYYDDRQALGKQAAQRMGNLHPGRQ